MRVKLLDRKEELTYKYAKQISSVFTKQLKFLGFINKEFDRFDAYYARVAYAREKDMKFVASPLKTQHHQIRKFCSS